MQALNQGPNMLPAVLHYEKCNTLCEVLYQPPPLLAELPIIDLTNQEPDKLPFVDITKTEVYKAFFSTSANTSPGLSQINYTIRKWAWPSIQAKLTTIMRAPGRKEFPTHLHILISNIKSYNGVKI